MPANTPNRGFPYPLSSDEIDVPTHIHDLAMDVDVDNENLNNAILSEQAGRIAGDDAIGATIDSIKTRAYVQDVLFENGILLDGGYVEATLDMFAVHVLHFNHAFVTPPAIVVSTAASTQSITLGVELTTTTTANVFGRHDADGTPAFFEVVAYYFLAMGQMAP